MVCSKASFVWGGIRGPAGGGGAEGEAVAETEGGAEGAAWVALRLIIGIIDGDGMYTNGIWIVCQGGGGVGAEDERPWFCEAVAEAEGDAEGAAWAADPF